LIFIRKVSPFKITNFFSKPKWLSMSVLDSTYLLLSGTLSDDSWSHGLSGALALDTALAMVKLKNDSRSSVFFLVGSMVFQRAWLDACLVVRSLKSTRLRADGLPDSFNSSRSETTQQISHSAQRLNQIRPLGSTETKRSPKGSETEDSSGIRHESRSNNLSLCLRFPL
jgi:hypothetical protein